VCGMFLQAVGNNLAVTGAIVARSESRQLRIAARGDDITHRACAQVVEVGYAMHAMCQTRCSDALRSSITTERRT
jgi:hypothetical protein